MTNYTDERLSDDLEITEPTTDAPAENNNNNTSNKIGDMIDNVNDVVDTVHKVSKISWRTLVNSFCKGIIILVFILFVSSTVYVVTHTDDVFQWIGDRVTFSQSSTHDKNYNYRLEVLGPAVSSLLKDMYYDTPNVDRVFVMEFHNGGSNTIGIPFCKGSIYYDYFDANSLGTLQSSWTDVKLTNFFGQVCQSGLWEGNVDIACDPASRFNDPSFYKRVSESGITYLAIQVIYNTKGEKIGILGMSCTDDPNDDTGILSTLSKYAQRISYEYSKVSCN